MLNKITVVALLATFTTPAFSQTSSVDARSIPARLDCGPLSSGKLAAFTSPIVFSYSKGVLKAERQLNQNRGMETYRGMIDPLGRLKVSGTHEGEASWELRFSGQLSDVKPTVLIGRLQVTAGTVGQRECKITFIDPPAAIMEAFSY